MKFLLAFLSIVTMSLTAFVSQAQINQTPPTRPEDRKRSMERTSRSADEAFRGLQNLDVPQTFNKTPLEVLAQDIQPLYRKPSKKDLRTLVPSQMVMTNFEQFLKLPNTGIFVLSSDFSCANNFVVIKADEDCASNRIPGGGTAFSFRVKSHRLLHLADLILERDILKTDGVMQQGIMVNLGDIELEKVLPETKGLKFLLDFNPVTGKEEMQKIDQRLSTGIEAGGFDYRLGFYADDKTTFALRSIAYEGKLMRSIKGVDYDEMDYDKRKDILIVFRIVEKDSSGNITILWKELFRKESPRLSTSK